MSPRLPPLNAVRAFVAAAVLALLFGGVDAAAAPRVFVHGNNSFRLPENGDTHVIMVGPGTGVAPFRSFVMDRATRGAKGPNWLFFGDQRKDSDFLYADEWAGYLQSGVLTRLDLAFSRDQAAKIYVQDRLRESAALLKAWLADGAVIYICGSLQGMASGVDQVLNEVLGHDEVERLIELGRYRRDVY